MELFTHIIYAYLIINWGIFWYHLGEDNDEWSYGPEERRVIILSFFTFFLFGSLIFFFIGAWRLLDKAWEWLNGTFQVAFWWAFYFTDEFKSLSIDRLRQLNKSAKLHFTKKKLSHWIIRRGQKAINKQDDYFILFEEEANF